jgi:hypothetical protein
MRIAWIIIFLASASWAQGVQNSEISGMVGGFHSSSDVVGAVIPSGTSIVQIPSPVILSGTSIVQVPSVVLSGSSGFTAQFSFGYQMASTKVGNLWLETPFTYAWQGTGSIAGATIGGFTRDVTYITPGVRLKTRTFRRVSFYGAAGGGYAGFWKIDGVVSGPNGTVAANTSFHPSAVFDYAGGVDLRLSRLLSLRVEGRDFVSAANLGGVTGHNHPVFLIGLVFHR